MIVTIMIAVTVPFMTCASVRRSPVGFAMMRLRICLSTGSQHGWLPTHPCSHLPSLRWIAAWGSTAAMLSRSLTMPGKNSFFLSNTDMDSSGLLQ